LEYAYFGMPAFLLHQRDGTIKRIISKNLPVMKYGNSVDIKKIDLSNVIKFLIISDGLVENIVEGNRIYFEFIEKDFRDSFCLDEFITKAKDKIDKFEDDVSIFYISKNQFEISKSLELSIKNRLVYVDEAMEGLQRFLAQNGIEDILRDEFLSAVFELLLNSYEHGNFGISFDKKQELLESDEYDEYLKKLESEERASKNINITCHLMKQRGRECMGVVICDEGDGFDTQIFKDRYIYDLQDFHGRGVVIVRNLVDSIYYNKKGNCVVVKKRLKEEI